MSSEAIEWVVARLARDGGRVLVYAGHSRDELFAEAQTPMELLEVAARFMEERGEDADVAVEWLAPE